MNPSSPVPVVRIVIIIAVLALLIGLAAFAFFMLNKPVFREGGPREEVSLKIYVCPDESKYMVLEEHGSIQVMGQRYTATAEDPTRYVGDTSVAFVKTERELAVEDTITGERMTGCVPSSGGDTDPGFQDRSIKRSDALPLTN